MEIHNTSSFVGYESPGSGNRPRARRHVCTNYSYHKELFGWIYDDAYGSFKKYRK